MFLLQNWVNNIVKTDLVLFVLIKILFLSCVFFVSICCAFSIKNLLLFDVRSDNMRGELLKKDV